MLSRTLRSALLPATLAGLLLAGCGVSPMYNASTVAAGLNRAKDAPPPGVDPAPFLACAKQAIELANKDGNQWRNAVLVSIEGHGLDQSGKLVPLLGGNWTFKFWANKVEDGSMRTEFTRLDVVKHVEGPVEILDGGEARETDIVRPLDPAKLSPPTQVVPFAIRLGLKVNRSGPGYNYYDVTYNSFYANPSAADANVADVVSYYQRETFDGLHIPADAGILAPVPAPAPATNTPPAPKPVPKKMTPAELARETAERTRQHG